MIPVPILESVLITKSGETEVWVTVGNRTGYWNEHVTYRMVGNDPARLEPVE